METGIFAGLTRVSGPALEPITVGLARTWLRRGDNTAEDTTIGALITAARQAVEGDAGLKFGTQVYDLAINAFPRCARELELPIGPLQDIDSVTLYSLAGDASTWDAANYFVDVYSSVPRLCLGYGKCWPRCLRPQIAAVLRLQVGYTGTPLAVTSVTRNGATVTVTTTGTHGLTTGEVVTLAGADQAEYNVTADVTVLNAVQFTVTLAAGTPASPATGAITATPTGVPAWASLAMRMRLAQFSENREGLSLNEQRVYDWLIAPHRAVTLA